MTYGYLRVSTDRQDENNQKLGVDKKAEALGVVIDEYIIDSGVSGTKEPNKRQLGRLLDKLKKGDLVIASEISRLGRSLYMVMRILEFCMNLEVRVITVKDNYELGNNITSKVLAFAFGLSAEIERDMISQRTREALNRRKLEGKPLGRPKGFKGIRKLAGREDEIQKMLNAGCPLPVIGAVFGVHRATVRFFINDMGLKKRGGAE